MQDFISNSITDVLKEKGITTCNLTMHALTVTRTAISITERLIRSKNYEKLEKKLFDNKLRNIQIEHSEEAQKGIKNVAVDNVDIFTEIYL